MNASNLSLLCRSTLPIAVVLVEKRIAFVLIIKKVCLCFFDGLEVGHYFQYVGYREKAAKLRACAAYSDATMAFAKCLSHVENDAQRCDADKRGKTEVQDDIRNVVVRRCRKALLDLLGNFSVGVLVGPNEKDAVRDVRMNAHGDLSS